MTPAERRRASIRTMRRNARRYEQAGMYGAAARADEMADRLERQARLDRSASK